MNQVAIIGSVVSYSTFTRGGTPAVQLQVAARTDGSECPPVRVVVIGALAEDLLVGGVRRSIAVNGRLEADVDASIFVLAENAIWLSASATMA